MATSEWAVENDISGPNGEAKAAGWLVWKMEIAGQRGCPDRWHFRKGVLVIIEYKNATTGRVSGNQKSRRRELEEQGFTVHIVDTHDHARRLLKLGKYAPRSLRF